MSNDKTEFDDELMALAATMPAAVAPPRDLWPGIEQAISQTGRQVRPVWNSVWAQAAAVVLLVGGSSGVTYYAVKEDKVEVVPVYLDAGNVFEPVSGEFGTRYTLGNEYLDARDQLESGLDEKLESLEPQTREDVIANLNTIRIAIREINEALAKEPDNVLLHELLLSTYHEEMSLMKKVDGIANSAMRRDDI